MTTKLGATPGLAKTVAVPTRSSPPSVKPASSANHVEAALARDHVQPVAPEKAVLLPKVGHVPHSAEPAALWGGEVRVARDPGIRAAVQQFQAMTPEAQEARIAELKTKRDELSGKILVRLEELDGRYKYMRNVTKVEMLRTTLNKSDSMSADEKEHLGGLLVKAESIATEIEGLKAQAAQLPRGHEATVEQRAERKALARSIKNLRSRMSEATKAATKYVDSLGLRTERLGVNEQKIDPKAPPASSPNSLLGRIAEWFRLDRLISTFTSIFIGGSATQAERELQQERERDEAVKERAKTEDFKRETVKRLELKRANARILEKLDEVDPREQRQNLQAALDRLGLNLDPIATTPRPVPS